VLNNIAPVDNVSRAVCHRTGCVVVSVNYQKAPEHKYPIPLNDCYAATQWVFENAQPLGIDADRIGVIGDSAGGNLAAAVTLKARDEGGPKIAVSFGYASASRAQPSYLTPILSLRLVQRQGDGQYSNRGKSWGCNSTAFCLVWRDPPLGFYFLRFLARVDFLWVALFPA
jgi:acetyl esterase/lipase